MVGSTIGAGAGCVTVAGGAGDGAGASSVIVVKAPTSLQRLIALLPSYAITLQK